MIKMHYKKIGTGLALAGLLSTAVALAETGSGVTNTTGNPSINRTQMMQGRKDARQEIQAQNVCERIANFSNNLNQKTAEQENNVKTRQAGRLTDWSKKTVEADANLAKNRASWEANRNQQFSKLETVATTDAQKKAVSTFEVTTKAAIATRQAAVDAAIKAFRTGVQSAITTRQSQVDGIVSSSISNRSAALAKAQDDCAAGKDAATVRADFQNGMKGARTQMQSDRQNVTKVSTTVQTLIQTRRATVEKAMSDFKAAMESARVALKTAFPDQASSTTPATTTSTDTTATN